MSDGQEKSDDLIAELAKLMASGASGAEEAKPAPRLVSATDAPRPATPAIRIPGMDAISAAPAAPATGGAPSAPASPAAAPAMLRIPGMDQPVAAAPAARPATPSPAATVPIAPAAPSTVAPAAVSEPDRRPATIDFGTLPPAAAPRPEPMANWQDREIPKPVPVRPLVPEVPAAVSRSVEPAPLAAPLPALAAPLPSVQPPPAKPAAPALGNPPADASVRPEAPIVSGKPAPAGDSFDFDFGFAGEAPQPPEPRSAMPSVRPSAPRVVSGDPIADLIAADLDAIEDLAPPAAPTPAIVRPPVQPPTLRSAAPQAQRPAAQATPRPPAASAAAPSARRASEERFAPVFGVGGKPATATSEPDPMDEIESLIGEAVRVELAAPERPAAVHPAPAPVVPPLNTGFAPRRTALKDAEPPVSSPEAAILAAAAASGAEVGRIDTGRSDREASPYKRPKAQPERRGLLSGGMRQYVGMAVAGTLLLAAGFGLYWVLGMGRTNDAEAPVLSADATPVKETPPPAAPADTQGSVVFDELAGENAAPADEQLVSRDDSAETSVADVARAVGDDTATVAGESELANRKVRTVTVRPDGTIVSGDDAVAGSEALPVDRPNVPELPGSDVQPSQLLAALPTDTVVADPIAATIATTDQVAPADTALTAAVVPNPEAIIDPNIVAPIPAARPVDRGALGSTSRQTTAEVSGPLDLVPADEANSLTAPVSASGGAYVQLSSQRTEADAQSSLRSTENRLSGLLGGRGLEIRRVDLGAKGIWYRVVLPTGSFQQATQACASFKANGADCVAING